MWDKARKAYVLLNVEPNLDCANPTHASAALQQAECVVALSIYRNPVLEEHADVILPITPFTETSGTYVNIQGEWQSFKGCAKARGASRPAWKVLRVLGNFLHLAGFDYEDSEAVKHEVKDSVAKHGMQPMQSLAAYLELSVPNNKQLSRIGEVPIYAVDSLVRRSEVLQETQAIMEGNVNVVRLHPSTAHELGLQPEAMVRVSQPHAGEASLPIVIDERIAKNAAWIPAGITATDKLGNLMGSVELTKA